METTVQKKRSKPQSKKKVGRKTAKVAKSPRRKSKKASKSPAKEVWNKVAKTSQEKNWPEEKISLDTINTVNIKRRIVRSRSMENNFIGRVDHLESAVMLETRVLEVLNPDWQAVADFNSAIGRPITAVSCSMIVPENPVSKAAQTIMIFIGLQSRNRIVQPILQWGRSQMGGGSFWSVGSCLAFGQFTLEQQSPMIRVQPGQKLTSVIQLVGSANNKFNYACFFEGIDQSRIRTNGIEEMKNCCVALESRRIQTRANYPASPFIAVADLFVRDRDRVIIPPWHLSGSSQHGESAVLRRIPGSPDVIELRF